MDPHTTGRNMPCSSVTLLSTTPGLPVIQRSLKTIQGTHSAAIPLIQIAQTIQRSCSMLTLGRVCAISLERGTFIMKLTTIYTALWWHVGQYVLYMWGSVIQTCPSATRHNHLQILGNQRGKVAVTNCSGFPCRTGFFPMPNTVHRQNILFHKKTLPGILTT